MSFSSSSSAHATGTAVPRGNGSSGSSSSNAAVVESHSVQSQFASLTRDRDTLRWQVEEANRQRREQEELLGGLRTLQGNLSAQLQTAHASLGSFQKQRTLLEQERVRLSNMLHNERQELVEAANKLQLLVETQQHSKHAFLQEMGEWNQELEQLLEQAETNKWKRFLSTPTIDMVAAANVIGDAAASKAMQHAKTIWMEAVDKKTHQQEAYDDLKKQVEQWRARAKQQQPNLDWEQLEKTWEHESSHDNNITVNLFYGNDGNDAGATASADDDKDKDESTVAITTAYEQQQQQHVEPTVDAM